ncbi:MAG: hypothetical protein V4488_20900 [Pseudomonadota bacterium]
MRDDIHVEDKPVCAEIVLLSEAKKPGKKSDNGQARFFCCSAGVIFFAENQRTI